MQSVEFPKPTLNLKLTLRINTSNLVFDHTTHFEHALCFCHLDRVAYKKEVFISFFIFKTLCLVSTLLNYGLELIDFVESSLRLFRSLLHPLISKLMRSIIARILQWSVWRLIAWHWDFFWLILDCVFSSETNRYILNFFVRVIIFLLLLMARLVL